MMKSTTLVERAIQRAETAGRSRVSVPTEVLADLLAQAVNGGELLKEVTLLAAKMGRRHPEFWPKQGLESYPE